METVRVHDLERIVFRITKSIYTFHSFQIPSTGPGDALGTEYFGILYILYTDI